MAVHESACSNATCTVMKEPFPLVLLSSSRQVGEEDDYHLDVLGAIAGHGSINNIVIGNNDDRIKKDGNNDNDKKKCVGSANIGGLPFQNIKEENSMIFRESGFV
jgi:hypothetical protein